MRLPIFGWIIVFLNSFILVVISLSKNDSVFVKVHPTLLFLNHILSPDTFEF